MQELRRAALMGAMAVMGLATPTSAQVTPERCALIGGATERLACYDQIFRSQQLQGAEESTGVALWTSGTDVSSIDGTETVFATLQSEQLIPARPNGRGPARVTFQCANESTSVQFTFAGQFLGTGNSSTAPITLQFDRNPPQTQSLPLSNDRTALGFFSSDDAAEFAERLGQAERLLVRATPLGQRSVTVSFVVEGLDEALAPVAAACGW